MRFSQRLRLLRNKRYEDWWHIVFGGPVGVFLGALVADVRWITANQVTLLATALRLAGAGLMLAQSRGADLAACALLQAGLALDITDGSIARYRKQPSALGAFLDKITDGLGLGTLGLCLGVRAYLDGHGVVAVAAGAFIGLSYLLRCYMYWVVAYLEKERALAAVTGASPAPAPSVAATTVRPFGELGLGERLRYYLAQSWRIVMVGEGDLYFWIGLALVLGRPGDAVLPLAGAMAVWLVILGGKRIATVMRLDRAAAAAREVA